VLAFRVSLAVLNQLFLGKMMLFARKIPYQAAFGAGARGEAGAIRAALPKKFPAECCQCLTWEQQGACDCGWQETRKEAWRAGEA